LLITLLSGDKDMGRKRNILIGMFTAILLICWSVGAVALPEEKTELEITGFSSGLGAVIVHIKNVGSETAIEIATTTIVTGGLFNSINLSHTCEGCSVCGSILDAGAIKTESTREAGFLFGVGTITIHVTAHAKNADEVSTSVQATILGPFIILK